MGMLVLDLGCLKKCVAEGAALRRRTVMLPVVDGGKVFPPTYKDKIDDRSVYAFESRYIDGVERACVVLDREASQANRLEASLLRALMEERGPKIPVIEIDFSGGHDKAVPLNTLNLAHRIYDAYLGASQVRENGALVPFKDSSIGREVLKSSAQDATGVFGWCPTALIFGAWDSFLSKGGGGSKFQRVYKSEIVGVGGEKGVLRGIGLSSKLDPNNINSNIRIVNGVTWELGPPESAEEKAAKKAGKKADKKAEKKVDKPSEVGFSNIAPTIGAGGGGVSIEYALRVSVISLAALRRLRFQGSGVQATADQAGRTALAALALYADSLALLEESNLRSGCDLVPDPNRTSGWEVVWPDGAVDELALERGSAGSLLAEAVAEAKGAGLPWHTEVEKLVPEQKLLDLVSRSYQLMEAGEVEPETVEAKSAGD